MAKVPKHRRIKRATVLIKRTRCIKNPKKVIKTPTPLYQKLKVNNHSLAVALSQERQEYRMLFARNNELLSEVQDLAHACNKRDLVISNILKNSKEMMQMLVNMSGFLTNVISSCQEFVSNQVPHRSSSSSSAGRRESTRRLSAKSPARGVVKPMVSGHTITKPTINLSRVNMQRLPNSNLSIIDESSSTPERNSDRSVQENRRSRGLSERLAVTAHRNEDDDERVIMNRRRSSRYSGGRSSSGRYSKRNSGRLSGAGRLSKRMSDPFEMKSPRVTLQDVSRYLTNNQTVNVRLLTETANGSSNASGSNSPEEDSQPSAPSSPEDNNCGMIQPSSQGESDSETSDSEPENVAIPQQLPRKSTLKSAAANKSDAKRSVRFKSRSQSSSNDSYDPLEGPSWLYENTLVHSDNDGDGQEDDAGAAAAETSGRDDRENGSPSSRDRSSSAAEMDQQSSPVSSLSPERRRSSGNFRVPELPKRFNKPPAASRLNLNDDEFDSPGNGLDASNRYAHHNGVANYADDNNDDDEEEEDEGERRVNLCFITQRRGRTVEDDEDDDDETMMLNMQRQLRPQVAPLQQQQQHPQTPEPNERVQYDINELLQLTPLKPLLNINCLPNGPVQPEPEAEPTVTVQLTQRVLPNVDETVTTSRMSTVKLHQSSAAVRAQEAGGSALENRRFSELSTTRLSSRVELPRLTEFHNSIAVEDNLHQQSHVILTPVANGGKKKLLEKRKRTATKQYREEMQSASEEEEEEEEETPKQKKKKPKAQRKKKAESKDPSSAKVVLQKLNENQRTSKSENKHSDESLSSARSSMMSRADQSSDSECSTNSTNSRPTAGRPRRQKAPKNLAEPSMKKKLRR